MQGARTTVTLVIVFFVVFFSESSLKAQSESHEAWWESLTPVSPVPAQGSFFSLCRRGPPFPEDPFPDLPLYTADPDSGIYFYDDRSVTTQGGGSHADEDGPPALPGGSGGSGGTNPPPSFAVPSFTITDDCHDWTNFWLVISNTSTTALVGIGSTLPGTTYNILTNDDLSTTNWAIYQTLMATSSVTWATPFSLSSASNMFFKASINWPTIVWATPQLRCAPDQFGYGLDASPSLSPDGSTIYIASTSNYLYAINAATGALLRSNTIATTNTEITSSVAISSNGTLYIGSFDGYLYSFSTNLTCNWSNDLLTLAGGSRPGFQAAVYATPAVTATGTIEVGLSYPWQKGGFFSFNQNSNENWFYPVPLGGDNAYLTETFVDSSAAVAADGTSYFLAGEGRLYALDTNAAVKWFFPMAGQTLPDSSPAIATDGSIVCGSDSPYVYCINPNGILRWFYHVLSTNDADEAIFSSPVIDSNGVVYVGAGQPRAVNSDPTLSWSFTNLTDFPTGVYAISNGSLLWAYTNVSGWIIGSCAVAADGTVYAGAASSNHMFGMLYAITNGELEWSLQVSNDIVSSPIIAVDGSVIFSCEDGRGYKVAGCSPPADSSWPMFHHDAQHTGSLAGTNDFVPTCETPFPYDGSYGGTSFSFSNIGPRNTTWSVYVSTNLSTWSNTTHTIMLDDNGFGSYTDSSPPPAQSVFYCLSNGCCSRVIGYVTFTLWSGTDDMLPGTNLIADPFYQVDDTISGFEASTNSISPFDYYTPMNVVSSLFIGGPYGSPGDFTTSSPEFFDNITVANWAATNFVIDTNLGTQYWLPNGDVTLLPGIGVMATLPTNQLSHGTNQYTFSEGFFVGSVAESVTNYIRAGTNYLGSALPIAGGISSALGYTNTTGNDSILIKWDPTNQVSTAYTNYGGTSWSTEPHIGLAEGFILISTTNQTWIQKFSPPCE